MSKITNASTKVKRVSRASKTIVEQPDTNLLTPFHQFSSMVTATKYDANAIVEYLDGLEEQLCELKQQGLRHTLQVHVLKYRISVYSVDACILFASKKDFVNIQLMIDKGVIQVVEVITIVAQYCPDVFEAVMKGVKALYDHLMLHSIDWKAESNRQHLPNIASFIQHETEIKQTAKKEISALCTTMKLSKLELKQMLEAMSDDEN